MDASRSQAPAWERPALESRVITSFIALFKG